MLRLVSDQFLLFDRNCRPHRMARDDVKKPDALLVTTYLLVFQLFQANSRFLGCVQLPGRHSPCGWNAS